VARQDGPNRVNSVMAAQSLRLQSLEDSANRDLIPQETTTCILA
jgi:hypothetical protein